MATKQQLSTGSNTAKKVKGGVLATNMLNFLLCYKLNIWFSPKSHLDITLFFLPLSTSSTKAELSTFILHQPLSLSLDISLTVRLILIPYLPKAVISALVFPGLSAAPWMGGLYSFSPMTSLLLFLLLPHRDQFSGPFHLSFPTQQKDPIFSIILWALFSHCIVFINCH